MNPKLFIIAALVIGVAVTTLVSTIGPQLAKAQIVQNNTQGNNQQQSQNTTQSNSGSSSQSQCMYNGVIVPCKVKPPRK